MADRMKKCSRCGEDIKLAAIKCRYCRADIVEPTPAVATALPQIAAPKVASHPQRIIADQKATQAHSSKKGVVAAIAAMIAVATVAVVLVATSSPNQKRKAPEPLQPRAAPPPADISLEIRSAPSAAVSIGGTGMGTTPLSVRTLRTATPTVVEIRVGGTTFKRSIVPDHDQTIDFGSVAPKKVVAVKRKDTAAGMDMPKECEDYTSAMAKLESCDALSSETRNALRAAYGRESANWAALDGDARVSLASRCKSSTDKLNSACAKSATPKTDNMELIDPYADARSANDPSP